MVRTKDCGSPPWRRSSRYRSDSSLLYTPDGGKLEDKCGEGGELEGPGARNSKTVDGMSTVAREIIRIEDGKFN